MDIQEVKTKILPVLKKYRIKRAGLFGSVAKGNLSPGSDLDLLVELGENISLLDFVGIKQELEDLLGVEVDLVEYRALKPRLKPRILKEEIRIYG